ncbi:MAG: hypothetical protein WC435_02625 [Candidatus Paceibacterota bacterium]
MPGILAAEPWMDEKFGDLDPSNNPNLYPLGPRFSENFLTLITRDAPLLREITDELLNPNTFQKGEK